MYDLIGLVTSYTNIVVLISNLPHGIVMVAQNNSASSDNRLVQTSPQHSACGPVHLVQLGAECNHVAVVTTLACEECEVPALKSHPLLSHQRCEKFLQ